MNKYREMQQQELARIFARINHLRDDGYPLELAMNNAISTSCITNKEELKRMVATGMFERDRMKSMMQADREKIKGKS